MYSDRQTLLPKFSVDLKIIFFDSLLNIGRKHWFIIKKKVAIMFENDVMLEKCIALNDTRVVDDV